MSSKTVKRGSTPKTRELVYCSYGNREKKLRPYEANIYLC